MDDEVVYYDFRRRARKSAPMSRLADCNIAALVDDLNEILDILEGASDKESLNLSEEEQGQVDFLNYMCDRVAEECHRLGFDIAPDIEIEVTLEPEKEDD